MSSARQQYAVVTGAYWTFTITDGALRMLVLLHLHELGRTPIEIATLFLFYEAFGIVTNFLGGWIGSRFGLKSTLVSGLLLQITALSMLLVDPTRLTIPWVIVAQSLSGVAKDLTKMSSKSFVKLIVAEDDQRGLMRWVAVLTGSKNALKGLGFFVGGVLLGGVGFRGACGILAGAIALAVAVSVVALPPAMGRARRRVGLGQMLSRDARLNWLAAARLFLFGSRDAWFVLALPLFLSAVLGWSFGGVGAFLAAWVIGYGIVQALTPSVVGTRTADGAPDAVRLGVATAALLLPLAAIVVAIEFDFATAPVIIVGLGAFGAVFAVTSAIHSYLVVAYAEADKVALRVGFYYMANAAGRLIGTLISGFVYQSAATPSVGLRNCLVASMVLVAVSALLCTPLPTGKVMSSRT